MSMLSWRFPATSRSGSSSDGCLIRNDLPAFGGAQIYPQNGIHHLELFANSAHVEQAMLKLNRFGDNSRLGSQQRFDVCKDIDDALVEPLSADGFGYEYVDWLL